MVVLVKCVYLASPYSHPDKSVMESRAQQVVELCAKLQDEHRDIMFYSPIVHSHPLTTARPELGTAFECWKAIDEELISRFDEVWVANIDGVKESRGVNAEVAFGQSIGKTIVVLE